MKDKITWINTLKGIGILFVVIGHSFDLKTVPFIYLVHMPMFFFISGFLTSPKNSIPNYIKKKLFQFVMPYFAYFILLTAYKRGGLPPLSMTEIFLFMKSSLTGGRSLQGLYGTFWFINCLIITQQIGYVIVSKLSNKITFIIAVTSIFLAYNVKFWLNGKSLIWTLDVNLMSLPIFLFGYLFKVSKTPKIPFIAILLCVSSFFIDGNYFDMKASYYGIPILSVLASLILITYSFELSKKIDKVKGLRLIFGQLGKSSLEIMYTHLFIFHLFQLFEIQNIPFQIVVSLIFGVLLQVIFSTNKTTRIVFKGNINDLNSILKSLVKVKV